MLIAVAIGPTSEACLVHVKIYDDPYWGTLIRSTNISMMSGEASFMRSQIQNENIAQFLCLFKVNWGQTNTAKSWYTSETVMEIIIVSLNAAEEPDNNAIINLYKDQRSSGNL
jgi:hypothetical protein